MKRGSREDLSYLPITLGTLDSLDYWTDPVVMSSVRPHLLRRLILMPSSHTQIKRGADLKDGRVEG